jgi:hypothetical protein
LSPTPSSPNWRFTAGVKKTNESGGFVMFVELPPLLKKSMFDSVAGNVSPKPSQ